MLSWPKGGRESDGVWAPYWYSSVYESTGFKPYKEKKIKIDENLITIYNNCMEHYKKMYDKRIGA
jgi:hypothetical protein